MIDPLNHQNYTYSLSRFYLVPLLSLLPTDYIWSTYPFLACLFYIVRVIFTRRFCSPCPIPNFIVYRLLSSCYTCSVDTSCFVLEFLVWLNKFFLLLFFFRIGHRKGEIDRSTLLVYSILASFLDVHLFTFGRNCCHAHNFRLFSFG